MQFNAFRPISWQIRHSIEQAGVAGVAGLALLAFCGMYLYSGLRPLQNDVERLRREAVATVAAPSAGQPQQPVDQLQVFYDSFPNTDAAPDMLAKLHDAAALHGVVLEQGEYTWESKPAEKMVRYGVVLPLKGDYVSMRKFLARVLADMPNVALDSVEFQRQKISETTLEARVRMTIFMVDN